MKELDFNGVYRLDSEGKVTLLDASMELPNGIGLSPDERTLYVANSQPDRTVWLAFDLDEGGGVAAGPRLFASAQHLADEGEKGLPEVADQRADVLPVQEEAQRSGCGGCASRKAPAG